MTMTLDTITRDRLTEALKVWPLDREQKKFIEEGLREISEDKALELIALLTEAESLLNNSDTLVAPRLNSPGAMAAAERPLAMPDMEAFMSAHKRNMDVLSAANRFALEGAQAVARWYMEMMQQSMTEMSDTMKALASAEGPQEKAMKQAEMWKRAYERAVANMRELSDLIQRSNDDTLAVLNRRFTEAMDEVKTRPVSVKIRQVS